MARANRQRGMTLVEVLVALGILGAVAASILALIGQNTRYIAAAEEQSLAAVVADNIMVESLARGAPLERGADEFEVSFAGRGWRCTRAVVDAGVKGVVRIDLAVRPAAGGQVLARASTLKAETR